MFVTTGADENAREQLEPTSASRFDFIASFAGQWSEYILHRYAVDNQDAIGDILISMQRVGHLLYGQDFGKWKLHHHLHVHVLTVRSAGMNYDCQHGTEIKQVHAAATISPAHANLPNFGL